MEPIGIFILAMICQVYSCAANVSDSVERMQYASVAGEEYLQEDKLDTNLDDKVFFEFDKSSLDTEDKDLLEQYLPFIKKAKIVQKDSGKFNLPKKKFPTFFCFEELKENPPKKQSIKRDVELNKTFSLRMFTDAETDYFERKISPGKMTVKWTYNETEEIPESYNGPFLEQHGLCVLKRISLPKELKEGNEANLSQNNVVNYTYNYGTARDISNSYTYNNDDYPTQRLESGFSSPTTFNFSYNCD